MTFESPHAATGYRASRRTSARRTRAAITTAALAAALGSLSACSSEADDPVSDGGLSGEPIVILATSSIDSQLVALPQFVDVVRAYASTVNEAGGIDGRPLEVTTCDNKADPTQTVACARQAVSDKAVAAVGWAIESPAFLKVLSDAKIPWVTGVAHTPDAFDDPNSFPVTIGSIFQGMGQVAAAAKEGCESVSLVTNEGFVAQAEQQQDAAAKQGIDVEIVTYPTNASDAAPYVAKMKGADCMIIGATSDTFVAQLGVALPQSGVSFSQIISTATLTTELASKSPETWEGAIITGTVTDVGTDAWAEFREAVKAYSTVDTKKHPATMAQPEWVSMSVVTNVIRGLVEDGEEVTSPNVQRALATAESVDSNGTGPALNFAEESTVPGFPRLVAPYIGFATVKDGEVVPAYDGEYHNVLPFILGEPSSDPFFKPSS